MISCLSSWKSIKKWIPDTLETTGRFSRRINPHLLQYIRSWQWRSQEKNDCVSHLSKALKAMYARWGTKKNYFGDPSWKMHFDKIHEMQVLKALRVKKRATPSRGPSLAIAVVILYIYTLLTLSLSICIYIHIYILCIRLSIHPSIHPSIHRSIDPSIHLSICPSIDLSIYRSIDISIILSLHHTHIDMVWYSMVKYI